MTTRPTDPRRNARRGATDASEAGYALANDAPTRGKHLGRKPAQLPHTGCHLYQAPASPAWFPGSMIVYQRCPRHQPAASIDLGAVPGHCVECEMEPFTVAVETLDC